jgi:hypothetical protein
MESGWFVVIGALIGAFPTLVIAKMNNDAQNRRQLRQLALEMAINERKAMIDVAKENGKPARIPSQSAFLPAAYATVQHFLSGDAKTIDFEKAYAEIRKLASESQACAQRTFDE